MTTTAYIYRLESQIGGAGTNLRLLSASIFSFLFLAPIIVSPEIMSVSTFLLLAICILLPSFRIPRGLGFLIWPIAAIVGVGLAGSIGKVPYDTAKDVWYLANPLLAIVLGYIAVPYLGDPKTLFRILVVSASVTSLYHISFFLVDTRLMAQSPDDIRLAAGKGYFLTVISISIIASLWRERIPLFPRARWLEKVSLCLCLISLILSFSRTLLFSLLIMLFVVAGLLDYKRVRTIVVALGAVATLLFWILTTPEVEKAGSQKTFRGKMANSSQEFLIKEHRGMVDINQNWRAYESSRALKTYLEGGWARYATGRGFGALVDVGLLINLGGESRWEIPILHNGYMHLLVKTGLVGVLLYVFYLLRFARFGRSVGRTARGPMACARSGPMLRVAGGLIVGIALILLATTSVVRGFLSKGTLFPAIITLGALISYARLALANEEHTMEEEQATKGHLSP